jgi:hypothetical protein
VQLQIIRTHVVLHVRLQLVQIVRGQKRRLVLLVMRMDHDK